MNRYYSTLFLLIIIFGIGNRLCAQEVKGSIITLEGKKIEGVIMSWDLGTNPGSISFKANPQSNFTTYYPKDIKSFLIQFNNTIECYEGGTFDIELSSTDPNSLSDTSLLILEKQTAFLQALYLGPKSLYVYRNTIKDQFYIKQDTAFELLVYKKYTRWKMVTNEHRKLVYENKKFQGQLLNYLGSSDPVKRRILNTTYNINSISELFETYYKLNQIAYQSFVPARNNFIKPGIVFGSGLLNMEYDFTSAEYQKPKSALEFIPLAGLTVEIPLGIKRSTFYGEYIFLGGYHNTFEVNALSGETYRVEKVYDCSFKTSKITGMFRYRYPVKRATYFANIGISAQHIKGTIDEARTTYANDKLSGTIHSSFNTKSSAFRISTGIGLRIDRLSVEGRIEPSFDKHQGLMASFLLNYYFGREID
ncbi:MAG TPA: hypothetical protein VK212_06055 [Lentimicrobium sp.]|nr:hypothetical protein [Lentimicrobium sp.]